MSRQCSVCIHPDRDAIDKALVAGEPYRDIAGRYGLSRSAVERHKNNHIPAMLAKAVEVKAEKEVVRAGDLLDEVNSLKDRALTILDTAEKAEDWRTALGCIKEARGSIELLARMIVALQASTEVDVLRSPEWLELRQRIITTLQPYPEAKEALVRALDERD